MPGTQTKVKRKQGTSARRVGEQSEPLLWVVGASPTCEPVARALDSLDVRVEQARNVPRVLTKRDLGIVFCPVASGGADGELRRLQGSASPSLSLFVVVDDQTADTKVGAIYRAGATAVFHWPREALILARLIAELLGLTWVHGPADRPDTALARAVRARLRLTRWPTAGIRIDGRDKGVLHLSGTVATLPVKRDLEKVVASVPGVRRVVTDDFWVEPSGRPDRSIAAKIRSVLNNTVGDAARTVSVTMRNGKAVLAGNVADRRELRRIDRLVAEVVGVRDIRNILVIAPRTQRSDRSLANRVQALLAVRFADEAVEVTTFAGTAVLSGTVESLARRREIEEFVEDQVVEVERVINKLRVA